MKIIMRRVSMIFYSENHRYDNAVRRCLLNRMKQFYWEIVWKMSSSLWSAPAPRLKAGESSQTGCWLWKSWICLNSTIVQTHTATGSLKFWILWMYHGQTVLLKAATTRPKLWNASASECVISAISETEFSSAIHENRAGAFTPTRLSIFLFYLYPNYWHRA